MTETRRGNAGGLYVKELTMSKGYERRCVDAIYKIKNKEAS